MTALASILAALTLLGVPVDRLDVLHAEPWDGDVSARIDGPARYIDPACEQGGEIMAVFCWSQATPPERGYPEVWGYARVQLSSGLRVPMAPERLRVL